MAYRDYDEDWDMSYDTGFSEPPLDVSVPIISSEPRVIDPFERTSDDIVMDDPSITLMGEDTTYDYWKDQISRESFNYIMEIANRISDKDDHSVRFLDALLFLRPLYTDPETSFLIRQGIQYILDNFSFRTQDQKKIKKRIQNIRERLSSHTVKDEDETISKAKDKINDYQIKVEKEEQEKRRRAAEKERDRQLLEAQERKRKEEQEAREDYERNQRFAAEQAASAEKAKKIAEDDRRQQDIEKYREEQKTKDLPATRSTREPIFKDVDWSFTVDKYNQVGNLYPHQQDVETMDESKIFDTEQGIFKGYIEKHEKEIEKDFSTLTEILRTDPEDEKATEILIPNIKVRFSEYIKYLSTSIKQLKKKLPNSLLLFFIQDIFDSIRKINVIGRLEAYTTIEGFDLLENSFSNLYESYSYEIETLQTVLNTLLDTILREHQKEIEKRGEEDEARVLEQKEQDLIESQRREEERALEMERLEKENAKLAYQRKRKEILDKQQEKTEIQIRAEATRTYPWTDEYLAETKPLRHHPTKRPPSIASKDIHVDYLPPFQAFAVQEFLDQILNDYGLIRKQYLDESKTILSTTIKKMRGHIDYFHKILAKTYLATENPHQLFEIFKYFIEDTQRLQETLRNRLTKKLTPATKRSYETVITLLDRHMVDTHSILRVILNDKNYNRSDREVLQRAQKMIAPKEPSTKPAPLTDPVLEIPIREDKPVEETMMKSSPPMEKMPLPLSFDNRAPMTSMEEEKGYPAEEKENYPFSRMDVDEVIPPPMPAPIPIIESETYHTSALETVPEPPPNTVPVPIEYETSIAALTEASTQVESILDRISFADDFVETKNASTIWEQYHIPPSIVEERERLNHEINPSKKIKYDQPRKNRFIPFENIGDYAKFTYEPVWENVAQRLSSSHIEGEEGAPGQYIASVIQKKYAAYVLKRCLAGLVFKNFRDVLHIYSKMRLDESMITILLASSSLITRIQKLDQNGSRYTNALMSIAQFYSKGIRVIERNDSIIDMYTFVERFVQLYRTQNALPKSIYFFGHLLFIVDLIADALVGRSSQWSSTCAQIVDKVWWEGSQTFSIE